MTPIVEGADRQKGDRSLTLVILGTPQEEPFQRSLDNLLEVAVGRCQVLFITESPLDWETTRWAPNVEKSAFVVDPDTGLVNRMNLAMERASGDLVGFFFADGVLFPTLKTILFGGAEELPWDAFNLAYDILGPSNSIVAQNPAGLGTRAAVFWWESGPPDPHGFFLTAKAYQGIGPFRANDETMTVLEWSLRAEDAGLFLGELSTPLAAREGFPGSGAHTESAKRRESAIALLRANGRDRLADSFALHHLLQTTPSAWKAHWSAGELQRERTAEGCRAVGSTNPLVSVITATYNAERYLERSLLSVFNQTYANIEVVVVDGGSTDGTLSILRAYDDRIANWVTEKDSGVFDAMNKGIARAKGEIIVLLNADDFFTPLAVELAVQSLVRDKADYTVSGCAFIDENEVRVVDRMPAVFDETSWFHFSTASHQTFFVRRGCYDRIGIYDTRYRIAADYKFRNLLLSEGFRVSTIPGILVYCSLGGLSTNSDNRARCLEEVYRIALETTALDCREDAEFLVLLFSEGLIPANALQRFSFLADKYQFSHSIRCAAELKILKGRISELEQRVNTAGTVSNLTWKQVLRNHLRRFRNGIRHWWNGIRNGTT